MIGPWLAKKVGARRSACSPTASTQSSIDCGKGTTASFSKYTTAQVVFHDYSLNFAEAEPLGPGRADEGKGRADWCSRASTATRRSCWPRR